MQVETTYTFKNYLYIATSGFFSQNKVEEICLISWGRFFKKTIITQALVGYEMMTSRPPYWYLDHQHGLRKWEIEPEVT